jgi:ABC-type sugar transport system substrate-binding protein/DNA-binding transcriptional regulator YhcF (GntR family)
VSDSGVNPTRVHELIRQDLLDRLGSQWQPGQWLPPVRELAKVLGAGHVSTHRAVAQLTREGYLLPLRGKGTRVLRGPAAVQGAVGGTRRPRARRRLALFRARQTVDMVHRMVDSFLESSRDMDLDCAFHLVDGVVDDFRLDQDVDAAVLFNPSLLADPAPIRQRAGHVLIASCAAPPCEAAWAGMDVVTVDQHQGGLLAGACLREAGCRRVCFVGRALGRSRYDHTSLARLRGFEAGWGKRLHAEDLMFGSAYGPMTGRHAVRRILTMAPRPDGLFAASDDLALGALAMAIEQGLKPGEDFHLVGFDGHERMANTTGRTLTTVEVPAAAMGRQVARLLRQRLVESETIPMRVTLPCTLRTGRTVRKARRAARPASRRRTRAADEVGAGEST